MTRLFGELAGALLEQPESPVLLPVDLERHRELAQGLRHTAIQDAAVSLRIALAIDTLLNEGCGR
jgi:hypothetical protein